jgi:hypothetical protein
MCRFFIALLILVSIGCTGKREPAEAVRNDTTLAIPSVADTHSHLTKLPNGAVIDSTRIMSKDNEKQLSRFNAKQVLAVYEAYRPLRRRDVSSEQLDSFLMSEKITLNELHAILETGDKLGWSARPR